MRSTTATILLMLALTRAAGAAATVKTVPGSATGEVMFRPDRAAAVVDAKREAREALERSCKNVMPGRSATVSNVRLVSLTAQNTPTGWDVTAMLTGTCTIRQ